MEITYLHLAVAGACLAAGGLALIYIYIYIYREREREI